MNRSVLQIKLISPLILAAAFLLDGPSQLVGQQSAETKAPLDGLVTMGSLGPLLKKGGHADNSLREANTHPGVYSGVLVLVSWDELEHVEGKLDTTTIDAGLNAVRAYNKKYPATPVHAKLRIFSGANTPDWVVTRSGGPILISDKRGSINIGHFWEPSYRSSWKDLQTMLAARYDKDPLLQEVAVSSCATVTAEPFIEILDAENLKRLHEAGFSDAGFKACLLGAIDDYSAWKYTALDYTFNPFRDSDSGKATPDPEFTISVMEAWRRALGSRGVIANHGLQAPLFDRVLSAYEVFKKLGPPIEFQTYSPTVDWNASVALGLSYGASEIEIWNTKDAGGPAPVSMEQLRTWAEIMRKSAPATQNK